MDPLLIYVGDRISKLVAVTEIARSSFHSRDHQVHVGARVHLLLTIFCRCRIFGGRVRSSDWRCIFVNGKDANLVVASRVDLSLILEPLALNSG